MRCNHFRLSLKSLVIRFIYIFVDWLTSVDVTILIYNIIQFIPLLRRHQINSNSANITKILIIRLDEIGDMVLTTPFFRELKRLYPSASITLIVSPLTYNLVELCPYVNNIIIFNLATDGILWKLNRYFKAIIFSFKNFRNVNYELVISPRWDFDDRFGAMIAYFSGAKLRMSYTENVNELKKKINKNYDKYYNKLLHSSPVNHEVEKNLLFIKCLGGNIVSKNIELWLSDEDRRFAENILQSNKQIINSTIIGIGPSCGNSVLKQWPIEYYIELCCWATKEINAGIILFGGPDDEHHGLQIISKVNYPIVNMIAKTTLRQAAALLEKTHLYVGNDTGITHLAAAANTKMISIFGSSCPHRFSPWKDNNILLTLNYPCSPCAQLHKDRCKVCVYEKPECLYNISVDIVKAAIYKLLLYK